MKFYVTSTFNACPLAVSLIENGNTYHAFYFIYFLNFFTAQKGAIEVSCEQKQAMLVKQKMYFPRTSLLLTK